ncbi:MAG: Phospholipase [Actinobacteria bacterium]|nr:Phospholipase [Actinomycetota bacterium]
MPLSRRDFLRAGVLGGAGLGLVGLRHHELIARAVAASAPPACQGLRSIEHVVILIQENRSFDHYFGTYKGVRGFQDAAALPGVFAQPGYVPNGAALNPWHLDSRANGACSNDISHAWDVQHRSWDGGAMDGWVTEHVAADGVANGALTMAYYQRSDLEFYYALADAFTICDGYHCSVLGPTDPNRLYSMTATIDPGGGNGGPLVETLAGTRAQHFRSFTWTTMPERLQSAGVSWKVYGNPDGNFGDNVLLYFKNYTANPQLAANAFTPSFPGTFQLDCLLGSLPQVSWVLAPLLTSEHPPAPPLYGETATESVLHALTANPALWARTALFVTWDENGGFFDHVPPPVAPAGTAGEYLTVASLPAAAQGIRGPIGLGPRVPMLVASPYSRGGLVCSDTFDHTSLLRFLETRFGVEVPNLSPWRRSVTGDLTSAFNFASPANSSVPSLPEASLLDPRVIGSDCLTKAAGLLGGLLPGLPIGGLVPTNPVPPNGGVPAQEPGTPVRPSGCP